jgi:hypothetical protein
MGHRALQHRRGSDRLLDGRTGARVEGVPVTTPELSIRNAHAGHLGNDLVTQAIAVGRRSGALSIGVAIRLRPELLGTTLRARKASASKDERASCLAG